MSCGAQTLAVLTAWPPCPATFRRPLSGSTGSWCGRKATTPVLPIRHGIKPATLVGEPLDQHVEEQPDLGA